MDISNCRYLFYLSNNTGEIAVEDVCGKFHIVETSPAGTPFHCCVLDKLPEKFKRKIVGTCADVSRIGYEYEVLELMSNKVICLQFVADGCDTLSAAAQRMREYAQELENLEKEGFRLFQPICEGLAQCCVPIKQVKKRKNNVKRKAYKHTMNMRNRQPLK